MVHFFAAAKALLRMLVCVIAILSSAACSHTDRFRIQGNDIIFPPSGWTGMVVEVPGLRWACAQKPLGDKATILGTWFDGKGPTRSLQIKLAEEKAWTKNDFSILENHLSAVNLGECVRPTSAVAVTERIVAAVSVYAPRRFADDLDIRYGYNVAERRVDLLPGMRLNVVGGGTRLMEEGNDFWLSGLNEFDVLDSFSSDGQGWATDLAAPLSRLGVKAPKSEYAQIKSVAGIGDLADPPQSDETVPKADRLNYRYWRIYHPRNVSALKYPTVIRQFSEKGVSVVVGAVKKGTIDALVTYSDAIDKCENKNLPDASIICLSFRNRATPLPMIHVVLNHTPLWVPLGTTLRDLIQQTEGPSPSAGLSVANVRERHQLDALYFERVLRRLHFERRFGGTTALLEATASCSAEDDAKTNELALPLAAGDKLSW